MTGSEARLRLFKKPLLFLMLNDTKEADEVGDWLATKDPEEFVGGQKDPADRVRQAPARGHGGPAGACRITHFAPCCLPFRETIG